VGARGVRHEQRTRHVKIIQGTTLTGSDEILRVYETNKKSFYESYKREGGGKKDPSNVDDSQQRFERGGTKGDRRHTCGAKKHVKKLDAAE